MGDLIFATKGQAAALAAQEALRKKALETKQEFEAGAKATQTWDAELTRLKSAGETALRSIQTEQEKIADKIAKIQAAQEKGLIPPTEAEEGIKRLRQQWIDVDEATIQAKKSAEELSQRMQQDLANALREVEREQRELAQETERYQGIVNRVVDGNKTALEKLNEELAEVEQAFRAIGADEVQFKAFRTQKIIEYSREVDGAKKKLEEVGGETSRLQGLVAKAFDPTTIVKWGLSFVGIKALIGGIKNEITDLQTAVDRRVAAFEGDQEVAALRDAAGRARDEAAVAEERARAAQEKSDAAFRAGGVGLGSPEFAAYLEAYNAAETARKRAAEAEAALADYEASPRGRRVRRVQEINEILKSGFTDLALEGDQDVLSTSQLEGLENLLREAGQAAWARRIRRFIHRTSGGTVSIDEAVGELRMIAGGLRQGPGGYSGGEFDQGVTSRAPTGSEIRQAEILERIARSLDELVRTSRDGGLPVTGE